MTKCSPLPWFRLYTEFSVDPKVQIMSEQMQRRLVMLFCLCRSEALHTLNDDEIAFALRISAEELAETKALFLCKGFIDETWSILNWDKRQFASDCSTERVRKHRQKQAEQASKHSEPFRNRSMKRNETRHETSIKHDTERGESDTERGETTKTGSECIEKQDETFQKRSGNVIEKRRAEQKREREYFSPLADAPVNGNSPSLSPDEDQTFEEPSAAQKANGREIPVKPPAKAEVFIEGFISPAATGTNGRVISFPGQIPFATPASPPVNPEIERAAKAAYLRHPVHKLKDLAIRAYIDRFANDPEAQKIFEHNHPLWCSYLNQQTPNKRPWLANNRGSGFIIDEEWLDPPPALKPGNAAKVAADDDDFYPLVNVARN